MGTRSFIGRPEADGWKARYVHWDGYPTGVGMAAWTIAKRDGVEQARTVLYEEFPAGWSNLTASDKFDERIAGVEPRFVEVPGYGEAYNPQTDVETALSSDNTEDLNWLEWGYIIEDTAIRVFKVDSDGEFTSLGTVSFDLNEDEAFHALNELDRQGR